MPTAVIKTSRIRENAPRRNRVQDRFRLQPTQFRITSAFRYIIYAGDR